MCIVSGLLFWVGRDNYGRDVIMLGQKHETSCQHFIMLGETFLGHIKELAFSLSAHGPKTGPIVKQIATKL